MSVRLHGEAKIERKTRKNILKSEVKFLVWPLQETDSKDCKAHDRIAIINILITQIGRDLLLTHNSESKW